MSGQSGTILDEDVEWLTEKFDNVLASIDSDEKLKKDKSKCSSTFNTVADSAKETLIAAFTAQATAEKNLEDSINEAYVNAMDTGDEPHKDSIKTKVDEFRFDLDHTDDLFEQFNKAVLTAPPDSGPLMKEVESLASIGKALLVDKLSLGKISPKFVANMEGKIEAKQKLAQTLLAELLFAKLVGTMNEQVDALESQVGEGNDGSRIGIDNRRLRILDQSIYTRLNKLNKLRVSVFQDKPAQSAQSALFLERLNSLNAIYHAKEAQILDKQADDCMSAINTELRSALLAAKGGVSARADMKAAIETAIQDASTGMAEMMALPEGSIGEDAYKFQYGVDYSDTEKFDDIALRQGVANAKLQPYIDRMAEKLLKLEPPTGDVKKVLDAATIYSKLVGQAVRNPSDPMPADQVIRMKTEMELAIDVLIGRCEVSESEATDHNEKQNITLRQAKQAYNRFCEVQGIVSKFALPDGVYDVMVKAGLYINTDGTFNAHLPTNNTPETRSKFQEDLKKAYDLEVDDQRGRITDEFSGDVLSQLSRSYEFSTSRQDWVADDPALPERSGHREAFEITRRANASTLLMCAERVFTEFDELMDTTLATVGTYREGSSTIKLWGPGEAWKPGILTGILDRTHPASSVTSQPDITEEDLEELKADKKQRTEKLIRALYKGKALSAAIFVVTAPIGQRNAEDLLDNLQHYGSKSFKKFLATARFGDGSGRDKFVEKFFGSTEASSQTAVSFLEYVGASNDFERCYGDESDAGSYRGLFKDDGLYGDEKNRKIKEKIQADFLDSLIRLERRYPGEAD